MTDRKRRRIHTDAAGFGTGGIIVVDKDEGWTSHDVVAKLRGILGVKKVGHAGTLDPMATGVLVVGVNKATRLLPYIVGTRKTYVATIRLGQATVTDDADGDVIAETDARHIVLGQVHRAILRLTGQILQVPSKVSAIKVKGQRSYAVARAGGDVELSARPVTVYDFSLRKSEEKKVKSAIKEDEEHVLDLDVEVQCSAGTYIRALARDMGEILGVGGHLTALRRTRVGPFDIMEARSVDELEKSPAMLGISNVVHSLLPVRYVSAVEAVSLAHGRWLAPTGKIASEQGVSMDGAQVVAAVVRDSADGIGQVVGLVRDREKNGRPYAVPEAVFGLGAHRGAEEGRK